MNRRGFLKGFVGVVAGAALAEELVPTRSIFLPPRDGWAPRPHDAIAQAIGLPKQYVFGEHHPDLHANAGIPEWLTNYMDPKVIDILVSPQRAAIIRRLSRA